MKTIDFTQPGGFPLTQDQLGYLQEAYLEMCNALAATTGDGAGPFVVSGCVVTRTGVSGDTFAYSNTAGWVVYGGQMIRVPAATLGNVNEGVNAVYMQITPTGTPLTYNNGSTPTVILDATGALVAQPIGTANSPALFLFVANVDNIGIMQVGQGKAVQQPVQVWNDGVPNTIDVSMDTDKEQFLYYTCAGSGNFYVDIDFTKLVLGSKVTVLAFTAGITGQAQTNATHTWGSNVFAGNWMLLRFTYMGSGGTPGSGLGYHLLCECMVA